MTARPRFRLPSLALRGPTTWTRLAICLWLLAGTAGTAGAQSAENVAVIINEASPDSRRVGEYYVQKRAIPAANVIRIRTTVDEEIERNEFAASIEQPIAAALSRGALKTGSFTWSSQKVCRFG